MARYVYAWSTPAEIVVAEVAALPLADNYGTVLPRLTGQVPAIGAGGQVGIPAAAPLFGLGWATFPTDASCASGMLFSFPAIVIGGAYFFQKKTQKRKMMRRNVPL